MKAVDEIMELINKRHNELTDIDYGFLTGYLNGYASEFFKKKYQEKVQVETRNNIEIVSGGKNGLS